MQRELERQVQSAMNVDGLDQANTTGNFAGSSYPGPARSEISFNLSEAGHNEQNAEELASTERAQITTAEREMLTMALNAEMDKKITQPTPMDANQRKVDSKDSQWKPAPIIGREMTLGQQNKPQYSMLGGGIGPSQGSQPPMMSTFQQNLENQQRELAGMRQNH